MKNLTKNMMIAAAALMVAAGAASAQVIKAEIPFSFRASGKAMPAGEYWVTASRMSNGSDIFRLANLDANRTILALPKAGNTTSSASEIPSLTFECTGTDCALVRIAPGAGMTYHFSRPRLGKGEDTRVAMIRAVVVSPR